MRCDSHLRPKSVVNGHGMCTWLGGSSRRHLLPSDGVCSPPSSVVGSLFRSGLSLPLSMVEYYAPPRTCTRKVWVERRPGMGDAGRAGGWYTRGRVSPLIPPHLSSLLNWCQRRPPTTSTRTGECRAHQSGTRRHTSVVTPVGSRPPTEGTRGTWTSHVPSRLDPGVSEGTEGRGEDLGSPLTRTGGVRSE